MSKQRSKYDYFKLDDFQIALEHKVTEVVSKITIKNAYSVLSGKEILKPNWYTLVVCRKLNADQRNKDYPNSWVVYEQSTGMIVADSKMAEKHLKTRDQAVDFALKQIRRNAPTKAKAMAVLEDVKNRMDDHKRKQIKELLEND